MSSPSPGEIEKLVEVLESLVEDRSPLSFVGEGLRKRLMAAAGRIASPDDKLVRRLRKSERRAEARARAEADEQMLATTKQRELRTELVFPTPEPEESAEEGGSGRLSEVRSCYVCKAEYDRVHPFYASMCPACGDFNFGKRTQTADLTGRVAIVTGARVKIGYHIAIKLLRAGARVIVTTRFPRDAAARFQSEVDAAEFSDRLEIHGVDLRFTPHVEQLAHDLLERLPRLDFIINNACQTVRRPPKFYEHLLERERTPLLASGLSETANGWLVAHERRFGGAGRSSLLSQLGPTEGDASIFPEGQLDADLQQVDLRSMNSWRLRLHEVSSLELLEVHLVNAVAPYVLNARLKPLMLKVATRDKHIVNVSAMEGQFYRAFKTDRHPHTNMAKAALNMMTRTSAVDYAKDGIFMNAVDTGWVTDEDPVAIAHKKAAEQGGTFQPPLDVVDGAARVLDPIFEGFRTGRHVFGQFLKDYRPVPW